MGLERCYGLLPFGALVLAMALWGSSFVAMKYSVQAMHPLAVVFGRMVVASVCFLPFARSFIRMGLQRRQVVPVVLMCLCEPCLYFLCEAAALTQTSASQAAMITSILPFLVAVAAGLVLGERITPWIACGGLLAAGGTIWLSLAAPATTQAPHPILGNGLEAAAMLCATGYTILMKRLSKELAPFFLTGLQAFAGVLFFAPCLLLPSVRTTVPTPTGALVILYLGTVITVGAYGLYNFGISRIPASRASAFVNLIPVFSLVLGFLLLGERLTPEQWLASGLVFIGVLLAQEGGISHRWREKA